MIQILGLREYLDEKTNTIKTAEKFFSNKWRAESLSDILKDPDIILSQVPIEERYNLYFTVSHCLEQRGRKLDYQGILPFDIDNIDKDLGPATLDASCEALGISSRNVGAVFTGNGIQFFIRSSKIYKSKLDFDHDKIYYRYACEKIDKKLKEKGLPGNADTSVFSPARLMRYPNTINDKTRRGKGITNSYVMNSHISEDVYHIAKLADMPILDVKDRVDKLPVDYRVDTEAVLGGCMFLQRCKAEPQSVTEEQWFAMLSVLIWMPNGLELCQEYSSGYEKYSASETEEKALRGKEQTGPRTCRNISSMWGGCVDCKHNGEVTSPVHIQNPITASSESNGFWLTKIDKFGMHHIDKPDVHGMVKYILDTFNHISLRDSRFMYIFNGKHWDDFYEDDIITFMMSKFNPAVTSATIEEVLYQVKRKNVVPPEFFTSAASHMFNMQNGVYNMDDNCVHPHSRESRFQSVLPFSYDINATCPVFDKFLHDIMKGDAECIQLLLEYMGYCLSGDAPIYQKAILFIGNGSNGKSTFLNILTALIGSNNVSSVKLDKIGDETSNISLMGKLVNIADEAGTRSLRDTESFKNAVSGGVIVGRKLYKDKVSFIPRAKFLISCNTMPTTYDSSHGFFRRMLIVPFNLLIDEKNKDLHIESKMRGELSGIFNRCVVAYRNLIARGRFNEPRAATAEKNRYMNESNLALTWFNENYEVALDADEKMWQTKVSIYQEYTSACVHELGINRPSVVHFWRHIREGIKDIDNLTIRTRTKGRCVKVIKKSDKDFTNDSNF